MHHVLASSYLGLYLLLQGSLQALHSTEVVLLEYLPAMMQEDIQQHVPSRLHPQLWCWLVPVTANEAPFHAANVI